MYYNIYSTWSSSSFIYYPINRILGFIYFDWVEQKFALRNNRGEIIRKGDFGDVVDYAIKHFEEIIFLKETFPNIIEVGGKAVIPKGQSKIVIIHALRALQKNEAYDVVISPSHPVILDYEVDNAKLVVNMVSPKVAEEDVEIHYVIRIACKEVADV